MMEKTIEQVTVGSILAKPVEQNGVLICKAGIPVSEQLKEALPKFGIRTVFIESVFCDEIDKSALDFKKLKNITYIAMKHLSLQQMMQCAKMLVQNAVEDEQSGLLHVLMDYDKDTYQHCVNVANFAVVVGLRMGLTVADLQNLAIGALLHDIGKSEIPKTILNKSGKLTDSEMAIMQNHAVYGYAMTKEMPELNTCIQQIIYQHHENYDGTGYPRNLYGKGSYRLARLVHICDVYEALCVKRPYKEPIPRRIVRDMMVEKRGTYFDPRILDIFLNSIPMYILGETIVSDGRVGIVCEANDIEHILVYCHGAVFELEDFEHLDKYDYGIIDMVS